MKSNLDVRDQISLRFKPLVDRLHLLFKQNLF